VSPGNFAGGLTTIEEKSMGAVVKSGERPIRGVIKVAQQPPTRGLWLLDSTPDPHWVSFGITNPNDSEGLIDLISVGCHLLLFTTGRGSVVGSPVAPTIKVTGNAATYQRMAEDMDFDTSDLLTGLRSIDEVAAALRQVIIDTASGELTKSELLGHKEFSLPYKYQLPIAQSALTCAR
jgi:altronate hydrolase